jgi:hypothetical protein
MTSKSNNSGKSKKVEIYRETTIERVFPSGMYSARPLRDNHFCLVQADTLRGVKNMIDAALDKDE